MRPWLVYACFLLCPARAATGIALYPISQHGHVEINAGSIVEYTSASHGGANVRVQGKELVSYGIIPLDAEFAPYRIFLALQNGSVPKTPGEMAALAAQVDLAEGALKAFGRSPILEDIEAQDVRLTYQLVNCRTEGKTTANEALTKARAYLAHYPQGRHRDELEWKIALWSHAIYEIEGDAGIPLRQARAYENFYQAHPASAYAEEIEEHAANAFRLGGDLLDYGPDAKSPGPGAAYRKKAELIYGALVSSKDRLRASRARVALYNLQHGRVPGFGTPASPPMDW